MEKWEFCLVEEKGMRRWIWVHTRPNGMKTEPVHSFDTLMQCMESAKLNGYGAAFTSAASTGKHARGARGEPPSGSIQRHVPAVLIVDDNPDIPATLAPFLTDYYVATATSGAEARVCMRQRAFDVYVIDYDLGDMSGEVLARLVRTFEPNAPILMFSGNDEPHASGKRHWTQWIMKGGDPGGLVKRIASAISDQHLVNETAKEVELAAIAQSLGESDRQLSARMRDIEARIRRQWVHHCNIASVRETLKVYLSSGGTRSSFIRYWQPVAPHLVDELRPSMDMLPEHMRQASPRQGPG